MAFKNVKNVKPACSFIRQIRVALFIQLPPKIPGRKIQLMFGVEK
jgi:hypothetical protein